MSTTLGFSEINYTEDANKPQSKRNQTRRRDRRKTMLSKAQTFLNSMKNNDDDDNKLYNKNKGIDIPEEGGASLGDFVPNPVLTRAPDEAAPINRPGSELLGNDNDGAVEPEQFKLLNQDEMNKKYYKQFVMPKWTSTMPNIYHTIIPYKEISKYPISVIRMN